MRGIDDWDALFMSSTPPTSDPFVTAAGELFGAAVGLPSDEPLAIDTTDGVVTFQDLGFESYDGQDFDVRRFVSLADTELRRLVVVVEWSTNGVTRREVASSLKAELGT